jgi:nitrous-oxide reductase
MSKPRIPLLLLPVALGGALLPTACGDVSAGGLSSDLVQLMQARELSEADVQAALKTYTPTGHHDEYLLLASGGHGGNLLVVGVPSMRILKYVGVFTPEPWQGYGYGDRSTGDVIDGGSRFGKRLTWGDMHHPALSETAGDYDGQYVFVGDKANARIAVVSLHDFMTRQIVTSELIQSNHGAACVTPNTEYVVETTQYPAPLGGAYAPIESFDEAYRGAAIFWKFDRQRGLVDESASFAIELPPYMQDLTDNGKGPSEGWLFVNSVNTERAYGGDLEGRPPLESGASQGDMDYLHCIWWKRAEEIARTDAVVTIAGMKVIPLEVAAREGLIYFVPEPKSPHGVDVAPNGDDIVVGGKLDTHATVYSFAKIKAQIDAKKFVGKDPYGVPILDFEDSIRGQCNIGLGPLHTQFDGEGYAYTSVFIESVVAKWSLADLQVVHKLPVHYNIGHLVVAEGDSAHPKGKYLIAMDKWSMDRFSRVGPLLPQNFQLVDLESGAEMRLLYDLPIPLGEPHYAQMIEAKKLAPIDVYTPIGVDPISREKDPNATLATQERIERREDGVHVFMTAVRSHFTPDTIRVQEGDRVHLHITSVEQAADATHGFAIGSYDINLSIEPGRHCNVSFVADRSGVFPFYCTEFCSALHLEMAGYLLVEPKR